MLFDLPKNQNTADRHTSLKYRVYFALLADVDIDNFPKAVNATISTNVLLPNKTWKFLDAKVNTVKPAVAPGASPYDGKLTIPMIIEGISKPTLSWLYSNLGAEVISVWERCSDGQKFMGGSPCSGGLVVKFKTIGDEGGVSGISLSLEGGDCPEPFWFYDGTIVREDPQTVTLGGATTFALSAKTQYLMTDNASAKTLTDITAVTDGDVGRVIELTGAGVNFPTAIASSSVFILQSGLSFSAKVVNSISFQITKAGAGYAFYEVYRS